VGKFLALSVIILEPPKPVDEIKHGGCEQYALDVQNEIGGQYLYVSINPDLCPGDTERMTLGDVNYSQGTIDTWNNHVAVINDGVVYDAMTGPDGIPLDEYKQMYTYNDVLNFTISDDPPKVPSDH